jgi:Co/Zn/Cd efflux system component
MTIKTNGIIAIAMLGVVVALVVVWLMEPVDDDSAFEEPESEQAPVSSQTSSTAPSLELESAPVSSPEHIVSSTPAKVEVDDTEPLPTPTISDDDDFESKVEKVDRWLELQQADIAELEAQSERLLESDIELDNRLKELDARLGISEEEFENEYPGFTPESSDRND